ERALPLRPDGMLSRIAGSWASGAWEGRAMRGAQMNKARVVLALMAFVAGASSSGVGTRAAVASDHRDTPTVIALPGADIGDLFAWTSSDGRRLNLVMTVVGQVFSDRLQYVFHVDSGSKLGETAASTSIVCRFVAATAIECWAGEVDYVR